MKLAPGELKLMKQQAQHRFVHKLAIYLLGLAVAVAFSAIYQYQFWVPVVLAVMLSHGTQLMHQLTHGVYTLSTDRLIGGLLGFLLLENFSEYRVSHLHHHRHIGTEQYHCHPNHQPRLGRFGKAIYAFVHLFKLVFYVKTLKRMFLALLGRSDIAENGRQRQWICRDYQCMLVGYVLIISLAGWFGLWHLLIDFWLLPLVIASVLHTLIEIAAHAGCEMNNTSAEHNARSIETNAFMRWYSNYGCFHAEHHKYMAIPVDALCHLRQRMHMQPHYRTSGYWHLLITILKGT